MEGFGDCMFCGHKVASKGNIPDSLPESLSAAIDQKEKLLEYDNNIEQRLKIIDDGTDWFEIT